MLRIVYVQASDVSNRDELDFYTRCTCKHGLSSTFVQLTLHKTRDNQRDAGKSAMRGPFDGESGLAPKSQGSPQQAQQDGAMLRRNIGGMCSTCRTPLKMIITESYLHPSTVETCGPPAPRALRKALLSQRYVPRESEKSSKTS